MRHPPTHLIPSRIRSGESCGLNTPVGWKTDAAFWASLPLLPACSLHMLHLQLAAGRGSPLKDPIGLLGEYVSQLPTISSAWPSSPVSRHHSQLLLDSLKEETRKKQFQHFPLSLKNSRTRTPAPRPQAGTPSGSTSPLSLLVLELCRVGGPRHR